MVHLPNRIEQEEEKDDKILSFHQAEINLQSLRENKSDADNLYAKHSGIFVPTHGGCNVRFIGVPLFSKTINKSLSAKSQDPL